MIFLYFTWCTIIASLMNDGLNASQMSIAVCRHAGRCGLIVSRYASQRLYKTSNFLSLSVRILGRKNQLYHRLQPKAPSGNLLIDLRHNFNAAKLKLGLPAVALKFDDAEIASSNWWRDSVSINQQVFFKYSWHTQQFIIGHELAHLHILKKGIKPSKQVEKKVKHDGTGSIFDLQNLAILLEYEADKISATVLGNLEGGIEFFAADFLKNDFPKPGPLSTAKYGSEHAVFNFSKNHEYIPNIVLACALVENREYFHSWTLHPSHCNRLQRLLDLVNNPRDKFLRVRLDRLQRIWTLYKKRQERFLSRFHFVIVKKNEK